MTTSRAEAMATAAVRLARGFLLADLPDEALKSLRKNSPKRQRLSGKMSGQGAELSATRTLLQVVGHGLRFREITVIKILIW